MKQKLNIFTRTAGGRAAIRSEFWKGGILMMSTYEEFMILLTFAGLIIAILNYHDKHKK